MVKIIPGQNNKLQICFANVAPPQAKVETASDTTGSTDSNTQKVKKTVKRKKPESHKDEIQMVPKSKSAKNPKYDRKHYRVIKHENTKLSWADLHFQPNMLALKTQFGEENKEQNPALIDALASAYSFNENNNIIRNRVRKDCIAQCAKKSLTRFPFNQAQAFQIVTYRPGSAFVSNQNLAGKAIMGQQNVLKYRCFEQCETPIVRRMESSVKAESLANDGQSGEQFTCGLCKRSDAKKYAKNLCQTCYKRQKKLYELTCKEDELSNPNVGVGSDVNKKEIMAGQNSAEWNGFCPVCSRLDVRHYAKGKCVSCYRKALTISKRLTMFGSEKDQADNSIINNNEMPNNS